MEEQKSKEQWKADPTFDADKQKLTNELKEQQNDRSRAGGLDPQIADFVGKFSAATHGDLTATLRDNQ